MTGPTYHGWTHRAKELGGTDPIPGLGGGFSGGGAIDLRNATAGAYFTLRAFPGHTVGTWFYKNGLDASIEGMVMCPSGFSTFGVQLGLAAASGSGNVVMRVATRALSAGDTPGALTTQSDQTLAVTTALSLARFPTSGNLASGPLAGDLLQVSIKRVGTSGSDSLGTDLLMLTAVLDVT